MPFEPSLKTNLAIGIIFVYLAAATFGAAGCSFIAFAYILIIYLPGFIYASSLKENFLNTFLLSHLIGFALGIFPLLLALTIPFPLTWLSFWFFIILQNTLAWVFSRHVITR